MSSNFFLGRNEESKMFKDINVPMFILNAIQLDDFLDQEWRPKPFSPKKTIVIFIYNKKKIDKKSTFKHTICIIDNLMFLKYIGLY